MNSSMIIILYSTYMFCGSYYVTQTYYLHCNLPELQTNNNTFYRMKKCSKLNDTIIARMQTNTVNRCKEFAIEKHGLAFNYKTKLKEMEDEDNRNCEILNCPDVHNLTKLVNDTQYDYYTLYGNTESIMNASCVPAIGLFQLNTTARNYSESQNHCHNINGNLANILTESRTIGVANIVSTLVTNWYKYKAAYVNFEHEECSDYRAWAPGHPRNKHTQQNRCVIIDSNKMWRTIDCQIEMPFICEIFPEPPYVDLFPKFTKTICRAFHNKTMRRKCREMKKLFREDYNNDDRCYQ